MVVLTESIKEESFQFQLEMLNFQSQFVFESNLFYFNESGGFFNKIKESLRKFIDKILNFFRNIFSKNVEKVSANINTVSKQSNETKIKTEPSQEEKLKAQDSGETITVASSIWLSSIMSDANQIFFKFGDFSDYISYFDGDYKRDDILKNKIDQCLKKFKNEGILIGSMSSKTVEEAHANFKEELEGTNMVALVKDGQLKITNEKKRNLIETTQSGISSCEKNAKRMESELSKFKQSIKKTDDDMSKKSFQDSKGLFIDLSNMIITSINICVAYLTDSLIELNKTTNAIKKVEKMFNI